MLFKKKKPVGVVVASIKRMGKPKNPKEQKTPKSILIRSSKTAKDKKRAPASQPALPVLGAQPNNLPFS